MKIPVVIAIQLIFVANLAIAGMIHPFKIPQPKSETSFLVVNEIPAGSFTKYEIDPEHGYIVVDRYQSMPVTYPANYGTIPSSLGGDGDPLDVLVFTREPIVPGAVIKVRAVGVLRMLDDGEEDDKIIAVPVSEIDPTYDNIRSINDLPEIERLRIEAFFDIYKQLPVGRKQVKLDGFGNANEAQKMVNEALEAYRAKKD